MFSGTVIDNVFTHKSAPNYFFTILYDIKRKKTTYASPHTQVVFFKRKKEKKIKF
jgi:hypothetical protein